MTWWATVLAGLVDEPHPAHGADLNVAFKGGVLHLSGELESDEHRQDLLNEARQYVGRGIDAIDSEHLVVARTSERPGVLDQMLLAAFADGYVAEFARRYLVESRRLKAKPVEILDAGPERRARQHLHDGFMPELRNAFKAGQAVLVLRVDETSAFRVRELLSQETRSLWTVATPPIHAGPSS
jgi:hypothetical protein